MPGECEKKKRSLSSPSSHRRHPALAQAAAVRDDPPRVHQAEVGRARRRRAGGGSASGWAAAGTRRGRPATARNAPPEPARPERRLHAGGRPVRGGGHPVPDAPAEEGLRVVVVVVGGWVSKGGAHGALAFLSTLPPRNLLPALLFSLPPFWLSPPPLSSPCGPCPCGAARSACRGRGSPWSGPPRRPRPGRERREKKKVER